MTDRIEVTIPFAPTAKARPRVTIMNGHAHAYTPSNTIQSEAEIKAYLAYVVKPTPFPKDVPLKLTACFYRARPKTAPKRVTMPVQKPDTDNHLKLLMDALNGLAFYDDSQVTSLVVSKRFCSNGDSPRIYFCIEPDK